jgi:hypothetical protein
MCPLCSSKRVRRSHRRILDFLLGAFGGKPMRCRTCSHRYYQWPWKWPDKDEIPTLTAEEIDRMAEFKPRGRSAAASVK